MDTGERAKIRAYLLRRLSDEERDAFEARLLEEHDLLSAVKRTEEEFLSGDKIPQSRMRKVCAGCLLTGVAAGALLIEGARRFLS